MAAKTNKTYQSGVNAYHKLCRQAQFTPFPLTQQCIEYFVSSLGRKVSHKTIKVYLFGVQHASILLGFSHKISSMQRLYLILRGIQRDQGGDKGRAIRNPILVTHLRTLCIYFHKHYTIQDGLMLKPAVTLAFFGMLRCGEYTSPTKTFWDPQVNLGYREISSGREESDC